jgi:hypothetical protein
MVLGEEHYQAYLRYDAVRIILPDPVLTCWVFADGAYSRTGIHHRYPVGFMGWEYHCIMPVEVGLGGESAYPQADDVLTLALHLKANPKRFFEMAGGE